MSVPELKLKVSQEGAQATAQQLNQVAAASDKSAQSAQKASTGAKSAAGGFQEFSKAGNDAAQIVGSLEQASQGGIRGIFGVVTAMKGLVGVVRGAIGATGPLGLLALVLGTLGGLFMALRDKAKPATEGLDSVATSAKKAADAAKELEKLKFEALKADIEGLDKAAQSAADTFAQLQKQAEEVDNAREGLELAKIANDPSLSDEGKASAEAAIRKQFTDRRRSREVGADKFQVEQAQKRNERGQGLETDAANELNAESANLARLESEKAAALKQNETAFRQEGLGRPGFDRVQTRFDDAKAKIEESSAVKIAQAREKLAGAEQRFIELNAQAVRSLEDRLKAEALYDAKQKTRKEVTQLQDQRTAIETQAKTGSSREQDAERARVRQAKIDEFGKQAEEAYGRGDNAAQAVAVFERNKLLREAQPALGRTPQQGTAGQPAQAVDAATTELKNAPGFDAQPVAESVKQFTAVATEKSKASQSSVVATASAITEATAQQPAPLDLSPIGSAFNGYHQQNLAKHEENRRRIDDLVRQIDLLRMQMLNSRR